MWFVMQERLFRYFHSGTSVPWIKLDSHIPTVFVPMYNALWSDWAIPVEPWEFSQSCWGMYVKEMIWIIGF